MDTAKLFMSGNSQSVRLPKKFRFEGKEVYIKKMGNLVILLPYHEPWSVLEESLDMFSSDFMEDRGQPDMQTREDTFE